MDRLRKVIDLTDPDTLTIDLEHVPIRRADPDDESPEFDQSDVASAVQLETIVAAKGLSADHVIVLGCDETNLVRTSRNVFFVALTRARKSLTLMSCIGGGGAKGLHEFVSRLPEKHIRALYLKADGEVEYGSVADLQEHLARWDYAKRMRARKAGKG